MRDFGVFLAQKLFVEVRKLHVHIHELDVSVDVQAITGVLALSSLLSLAEVAKSRNDPTYPNAVNCSQHEHNMESRLSFTTHM